MSETMTDQELREIREAVRVARLIVDGRAIADFRQPLDPSEEGIRALVQERVPRLLAEIERLRAAVLSYGRHRDHCACFYTVPQPCTCGLNAVIDPAALAADDREG